LISLVLKLVACATIAASISGFLEKFIDYLKTIICTITLLLTSVSIAYAQGDANSLSPFAQENF
jgi:hypothetical protein